MPEVHKIFSSPIPVWHIISAQNSLNKPDVEFMDILVDLFKKSILPKSVLYANFRCVSIDRLPLVLKNGIDVVPTDAVIYVDSHDKALEYGGWPKVLLALDSSQLNPTWKEVESNLSQENLDEIRKTHQTEMVSIDGAKIWFSRLPENDRRVGSAYEVEYAKYIPGDSKSALMAAFVFAGSDWSPDSSVELQPI